MWPGPDIYKRMVEGAPQLERGQVWCLKCGHTEKVDSADSLRHGWPKCCGHTMTIDDPGGR